MVKDGGAYKFYLDISGNVRKSSDDIYIGCILFNDYFKPSFRDKFYREFPSLKSFRKKGSSIHPDKLKQIIKFMDEQNVKMAVVLLPRHIINKIRRIVEAKIKSLKTLKGEVHIKDFEEKIMGLAYFNALAQHGWLECHYDCFFCSESQFDIQQTFISLSRIAHMKGRNFRPAYTSRRVEHMLKFADFTASAARKVDKFVLDQYKRFKYVKYEPSEEELDIVFNLSRREGSKRNV